MICKNPKGGNCKKSEVVYCIACKSCKGKYFGESHRNAQSRSIEHWNAYHSKNPKVLKNSVMWRHQMEKHDGQKVEFEMSVVENFQRDPLGRQSMEGMLIREQDPEDLINNKEEWNQPGDVRIEFNH